MTDKLDRLRALEALLRLRHVGRAAAAIGTSQPTMSRLLARLRAELDDPLLVRTSRGYAPTRRAAEIAADLPGRLAALEELLVPARFEPRRASGVVRLGMLDYEARVYLPRLAAHLAREAPEVRLEVVGGDGTHLRHLSEGTLDCAIQSPQRPPVGIYRAAMFSERLATLHPAALSPLDLEAYLARPHVVIGTPDEERSAVDLALAAIGRARRIALRLPYFSAGPALAASGGFVFTAPARLLAAVPLPAGMRISRPPLPVPRQSVPVTLYWHERRHRDPLNRWFRRLALEVARREMGPPP